MTVFNVAGLLVAGWIIGDMITLTFLVLNRHRIRTIVASFLNDNARRAVDAERLRVALEKNREESEDQDDFNDYDGCDGNCENCN